MTARSRVTAGLVTVVALATAAGWYAYQRSNLQRVSRGNLAGFADEQLGKVQVLAEVLAAADVVVTQQLDGRLKVTGRAVKDGPVTASSLAELGPVLRRYPGPGLGIALVAEPSSNLMGPVSAENDRRRGEIEAVLADAGFKPPVATSTRLPAPSNDREMTLPR